VSASALPALDRPLRVVVVDDEKPARRRLIELLEREPNVEIADVCGGGRDAVRAVRGAARSSEPVDVLFLDVQMPEVDGFAVLDSLAESLGTAGVPAVVFVTAYDQYALRAFDAHVVDYLLKPFSDERFRTSLSRAAERARGSVPAVREALERVEALLADVRAHRGLSGPSIDAAAVVAAPAAVTYLDRIVVKSRGRVRFLPVEEIAWIEADDVYVRLHSADRASYLHRAPLRELEASLDPRRFVRIHRSAIVNLEFVAELQADSHGEFAVLLRDRTVLRLSRSYRPALEARLGQRL
jgi:two-component system LytT family response regulator